MTVIFSVWVAVGHCCPQGQQHRVSTRNMCAIMGAEHHANIPVQLIIHSACCSYFRLSRALFVIYEMI
jgi:hypothetical protein